MISPQGMEIKVKFERCLLSGRAVIFDKGTPSPDTAMGKFVRELHRGNRF